MSRIIDVLRKERGLVLCGLASLGIWIAGFVVPKYDPSTPVGRVIFKVTGVPDEGPALLFMFTLVPYLLAYALARKSRGRGAMAVIWLFAVAFSVTLVARAVPMGSHDIYKYIFLGRVTTEHGANPYAVVPSAYPDDLFVQIMGPWPAKYKNLYGPIWTAASTVLATAVGDRPMALIVAFKVMTALVFLAGIPVIIALYRAMRPGAEAGHVAAVALLYAWNPVLLFESAQNGHNDIVMVVAALSALLFASRRRPVLAGLALAASVMVKYATVVFLPFLLLYLFGLRRGASWRDRLRDPALFALAFTAGCVGAFAPYWFGPATLDGLMAQAGQFGTDVLGIVPYLMTVSMSPDLYVAPGDKEASLIGSVSGSLYAVAVAAALVRSALRGLDLRGLVVATVAVHVLYVVVAGTWIMPWYFLWFLPALAVLDMPMSIIVSSAASFLLYGYFSGPLFIVWLAASYGAERFWRSRYFAPLRP